MPRRSSRDFNSVVEYGIKINLDSMIIDVAGTNSDAGATEADESDDMEDERCCWDDEELQDERCGLDVWDDDEDDERCGPEVWGDDDDEEDEKCGSKIWDNDDDEGLDNGSEDEDGDYGSSKLPTSSTPRALTG